MIEPFSIDLYHFLIFIIPGFMMVWFFSFLKNEKQKNDPFSLAGLSFFWGLILLMLWGLYIKLFGKDLGEFVTNPYSAAFGLSLFGLVTAWVGFQITKKKFFRKIVEMLRKDAFIIRD